MQASVLKANNAAQQNVMQIRKSADRGHANHGWLDSYHTFSFSNYYDPAHMSYSALRVINEDVIAAAKGFGTHGHNDMEIITYMLQGELEHKDSMGNGSVIKVGDVQRMTAGTGVRHSEFNPSPQNSAHLLQIWILPDTQHLAPSYEEKYFDPASKHNQWRLIASHDARLGSVKVHQDMDLFASLLDAGESLDYQPLAGRKLYIQLAKGNVMINGEVLEAGDAVAIDYNVVTAPIHIVSQTNAEILLFDLP